MSNAFDKLHPLIKDRQSGRAFTKQQVDHDTLNILLEAARWGPSCGNRQPWRYVIATEPTSLNALQQALSGGNAWAKQAPVLMAVVSREDFAKITSDGRKYYQFDSGLGTQNLLLQATELGLMCHAMGGFDANVARKALNIPDSFEVICLIAIGHPDNQNPADLENARGRTRKPLDSIASFESWSEALENPDKK
jgi:nitroreductase